MSAKNDPIMNITDLINPQKSCIKLLTNTKLEYFMENVYLTNVHQNLTCSTVKALVKLFSASSANSMYMGHTPSYRASLCCILLLHGHQSTGIMISHIIKFIFLITVAYITISQTMPFSPITWNSLICKSKNCSRRTIMAQ